MYPVQRGGYLPREGGGCSARSCYILSDSCLSDMDNRLENTSYRTRVYETNIAAWNQKMDEPLRSLARPPLANVT